TTYLIARASPQSHLFNPPFRRVFSWSKHMTKVLSVADLHARGISYSKVHLWRLCKTGAFPKAVKIGAEKLAWVESEVEDWITSKIAARDGVLPSEAVCAS